MKMRLIRKTTRRAVYQLEAFSQLNNALLEKISWPENIRGMILTFKKSIDNEQQIMDAISDKYWVTLGYSVERNKLATAGEKLPDNIKSKVLADTGLRETYLKTQRQFYKSSRKFLGAAYLKEVRMVAGNMLQSAKYLYLTKNNKSAALLVTVKWKDYMDVPVNWVLWVWINNHLPAAERSAIRCHFAKWLKLHSHGRVQCVVNSFNLRSQRFFRKMGFIPECVHYMRSK